MPNLYGLTSYIESNTVVNRAIMELGGYAAPDNPFWRYTKYFIIKQR